MQEVFKKFSKALHKKHDALGKRAARKFFRSLGFIVDNNPYSKAKSDLVLMVNSERNDQLEAFHSEKWFPAKTMGNWPWSVYHIPHRKAIGLSENKTIHWIAISEDASYLAFYDGDVAYKWIQNNKHEEVSNSIFESGERYYRLPVEFVETYPLDRKIRPEEFGPYLKALIDKRDYSEDEAKRFYANKPKTSRKPCRSSILYKTLSLAYEVSSKMRQS